MTGEAKFPPRRITTRLTGSIDRPETGVEWEEENDYDQL